MPQAAPRPQAAPAAAARSAPAASYEPTIAVPRQSPRSRRRSRVWQYVLVALVVIGGGAAGGLQLRKLRLDWEIDTARTRADELMTLDTYAGYLRARNVYASIVAVRATPGDEAALARSQAALAAEFDEGYAEAQAAVRALGDAGATDAVLARAYLALADRDAAGALAQANALASQAPDDPFAAYLVGRARLLTGDHPGALDAFQKAVERSGRPLFLVWLGRAHLALGQQDKAAAAFARALERVPGHPVALLGRAELAAAGTEPAPDGLEASLEALIEEGARPLAEQASGVSSGEMAGAALALVGLRMQRGDEPGARKALDQLQGMRREGDPGFAVILARALERLGDTDAALAELARAVEAGPTRLDARVAWAELALRAGKLDAARAALVDIDEATSEVVARNVSALALRGRTQLALGALDRALADLDAALAEHPDIPELIRARAEIDLLQGNAVAAAERLAPVAGEDAPSEMRVVYAAALRSSGQYDQARAVLEAVQKDPAPPPRLALELARLARDQGRWVEARNAYADAIERLKGADGASEARTEARIEAVRLALDTGDRAGARETIAAMAKEGATRNDGRVLVEAARIHTLDGAHEQAAGYLERAAALSSPPQPALARERGRLALRQGDAKAAARALEAVRSRAGGDPETLLLLIEAELAQGNREAAAALYQDVAARPGMDPAVLSLAAGLVAAAGDKHDDALAAFEKARELLTARNAAPRLLAQVDFLTGRTLFEYDRLREAEKVLEKAIRTDPGHADPYFVLGMVEYGRSEFGDAADAFEEAIQRDAASLPEAWFYLGEVELERDNKPEARAAFQAYLELSPDSARAVDARRYLGELGE
jgi:tetratricopeptide (TPR) repeat protein